MPELSEEQSEVFKGIDVLAASGKAGAALPLGVTGAERPASISTLSTHASAEGKRRSLLVPEIALTPQMLRTFSSHFGDDVAVMHSSLSPAERYDEWKRVKTAKRGSLSAHAKAVFAPLRNLGAVIIDEEQEETYKSENNPRYDARDVASSAARRITVCCRSAPPRLTSVRAITRASGGTRSSR